MKKNELLKDYIWAVKKLKINVFDEENLSKNLFTSSAELLSKNQLIDTIGTDGFIEKFIEYKQNSTIIKPNRLLDINLKQLFDKSNIEKIYFHCGTPKTGSSSFQSTIVRESELLKSKCILYPSVIKSGDEPKHQQLVVSMKNNDINGVLNFFIRVIKEANEEKLTQVVISTEGIFNHWNDFSDGMKFIFATIKMCVTVKLLLVLRDPVSFLYSLYQQNLKNPQMKHPACYGKDLSFEEMLNDSWFVNHIDYLDFILGFENMIGKNSIQLINYSKYVLLDLFTAIGLNLSSGSITKKNITSLSLSLTELREVNRLNLSRKDKLKKIEQVMNVDKNEPIAEIRILTSERINQLFFLQRIVLKKNYGFNI